MSLDMANRADRSDATKEAHELRLDAWLDVACLFKTRSDAQTACRNGKLSVNGQAFAIFVIVDAAAEAAVGLGILIALFRNKETVQADEMNLMKW